MDAMGDFARRRSNPGVVSPLSRTRESTAWRDRTKQVRVRVGNGSLPRYANNPGP